MHHHDTENEPQLSFTRNPATNEFREGVTGWFLRGHPLTISYDPTRVVPPGDDYRFGDPARPVVAHVQFREDGPVTAVRLESWIGTPTTAAPTSAGRAPKLQGRIDIPDDAEWVTVWVTYTRPDGTTLYDSSFGRNFRFRFYHDELAVLRSDVVPKPGSGGGRLAVRVATDPAVERVVVRYRVLTDPPPPAPTSVDLRRTGEDDPEGRTIWEAPDVAVPADRVTAFDFVYFAADRPFKDNNQGQFFLAVDPAKRLDHTQ
ncbi:MAG: hypothetical protein JWO38_8025 [Gemmataceae bacterium]|nr:hypothetical protein [Gemmataceae bacterium]